LATVPWRGLSGLRPEVAKNLNKLGVLLLRRGWPVIWKSDRPKGGFPAGQIHLGLTDLFAGIFDHPSIALRVFPIVYGMQLGFSWGQVW
jgi:hypothetical protein